MMDIIDKAQENDELFRKNALNNFFRNRKQGVPIAAPESDCRSCRDCGEEIDQGRLKAVPGAVRCIDCQGTFEKRTRQRA